MTIRTEKEAALPLVNSYGRAQLTLLGVMVCSLLVFGFLLLLKSPAQAWTTKYASCSSSACHAAAATAAPAAVMSVAVNGTAGASVTVAAGSTFEIDWMFTNMVYNTKYTGTAPEVALPTGWTLQSGTANSPSLTGWSSTWDVADGVGWATSSSYSTAAEFPNSPVGYTINFNGTSWDNGNRNCALDDGTAGDLDGVANKMGTDARITVPAGTVSGTYTVMVTGIGHNESDTKSHIEQAITVNVVPVVTSTSPNSLSQGTTQDVLINGAGFTNTGLSSSFGSGITVNSTTYNSATQVTANITIDGAATVGSRNVSVTCSGQTGNGTGVFSVTTSNLTATTTTVTNPTAITYGQSASFTATIAPAAATGTVQFKVDGANVGSPVTVNSGSATISGVTGLAAGSRSVTAVYSGDASYATSTSSAVTQTVNVKTLTITADAKSKTYGAVDPALTYTSSGLVGGDTITGSLTRAAGENVGNYAINQGTLSAGSNYSISYTGANLTITAKTLTITADAKSKTYGAVDPALTYTSSGLVGGDTISGSLTRAAGENVGTYAINQGTLSAGSNYTLSYTGASLTINAAALSVTADAKSKTYGAVDPVLTYTASGFVNGDTNAIMSGSLTRAAGENVGNYAINQSSVAATSNYTISYTGANLTVTAATLTVTAETKSKTYGAADPALTYTASGFVNGDTSAIMTGTLSRAAGENVGNYAINQGTVAATSNYTITYTSANLTVNAASLSVTAEAKSKTYGAADPALTYIASGFVNGDTNAIMSGSLTRAAGENVGNYAINQGSVAATSNYTISYTGANLTITVAGQSITVTIPAPATAVYLSQFTVAATASSSLAVTYSSGSPSICTNSGDTFTMISGTGTCIVQYDQAGDANYSAAPPVTNSVTADKASQTIDPITFNPTTLAVSGTTTAIAATTSGLTVTFSSDTPLVCTVSGTTVTGVSAGDCTVRASQAGNGNYSAATDVTQLLAVTGGSTTVTLTVTTAGDGTATVVSAPGSIVCARDNNLESGVCSDNTFTNPTDVTLTAAPDERTEVSWTGGCTATGNSCGPFTLNSNSGVTATFNFKQRVKLPGNFYYATIQGAYNAAIMGATTLQLRDETFSENLLFDGTLDVTVLGGHDATWAVVGNTTVSGTVTIGGASGSVTISNLIIE